MMTQTYQYGIIGFSVVVRRSLLGAASSEAIAGSDKGKEGPAGQSVKGRGKLKKNPIGAGFGWNGTKGKAVQS